MKLYYYHDGSFQQGPFTLEELKLKNLSNEIPVWHEGLSNWTDVKSLPELRQSAIPPPINSKQFSTNQPSRFQTSVNDTLEPPAAHGKGWSFGVLLGIGVTVVGLVVWLIFNNRSHADELQGIKSTQAELYEKQDGEIKQKQEEENRRRKINEELTRKNMEYRNNWSNYVVIGDAYYQFRPIGGIDEFDLPVKNNTDYMLDEVEMTVSYIKANGDTYKTETVWIYNVPPHGEKSGKAPSSSRGTSVRSEISGIISKKMHFCYPAYNGNAQDPYFCK